MPTATATSAPTSPPASGTTCSITRDRGFAETMWPVVEQGHRLRARLQLRAARSLGRRSPCGSRAGCAADRLREHLPQHPVRAGAGGLHRRSAARVGGRRRPARSRDRAIIPRRSSTKDRDVDGVVLPGARRCAARRRRPRSRIDERWDDFVVPGLGIRCVDDRPWVTGAETCELVMALDAIGDSARAHEQFAAMHHLREARRILLDRTGFRRRQALAGGAHHVDGCGDDPRRRRAVVGRPRAAASSAGPTCRAASRASIDCACATSDR